MPDITNGAYLYPPSGDYTNWQNAADQLRGMAAQFVGQPYDVYRITSASNGNFIANANKVFANFPLQLEKIGGEAIRSLLTEKITAVVYKLLADLSLIKTGDVFVLNDPVYGQGANSVNYNTTQYNGLAIASHGVLKFSLGGRLDRNVKVYRPAVLPVNNYLISTTDGAQPLQCVNGNFQLANPGDPAHFIPSGFSDGKRSRGPVIPNVPDLMPRATWNLFGPPLPGFTFRENDIIISEEGDRYRVVDPFRQDTAFVGYQLQIEREVSQP